MKNKGFTLIELLSTMLILGIITTIAIQSYFVLSKNNDESKYNYYMELVRNGADLYFESKKSSLSNGECLTVTYKTLKDKDYIKESNVTCNDDGIVLVKRIGNKYDYNLNNLSCVSGNFQTTGVEVTCN